MARGGARLRLWPAVAALGAGRRGALLLRLVLGLGLLTAVAGLRWSGRSACSLLRLGVAAPQQREGSGKQRSSGEGDRLSNLATASSLALIRQHHVFNFSTAEYPFQEAVVRVLEEEGGEPVNRPISLLHESGNGGNSITDKSGASINFFQSVWNKDRHLDDEERGAAFAAFNALYIRFVAEIVGPSLGGGRVLYQRAPTLRVYIPGQQTAMGKFHRDEDYLHQPSEINFWFPVSEVVAGANSLWVESSPDRGDFEPLALSYGQCFRGWLNQCRHGCMPNDTGRTRVSIDFRCVSAATGGHDPAFKKGLRRGPKAKFETKFDVGGFYSELILPESEARRLGGGRSGGRERGRLDLLRV